MDDRPLDGRRFLVQVEGVAQHHGRRGDGGDRVGEVQAGDVGRAPVDRLVQSDWASGADAAPDAGRGEHADRAGQHGGLIAQDVAEQVGSHEHVELLRVADELHGAVVHVEVDELDVRIAFRNVAHHAAPERRGFEDVRLVHRGDLAPPLAGRFEGDLGDADDLRRRVDLGVDAPLAVRCFLDALGLAEVDAAGQLADDQEIGAGDDLRLERGGVRQHGVQLRGAQVGVQAQLLAQAQQRALRAHVVGQAVPLGAAHGAEENRVARLRELERLLGKRPAGLVDGGAARVGRAELEGVAVLRGDLFEDLHGLRHDLGPDPVAGQDCDARLHVFSSPAWRAYANTPPALMMSSTSPSGRRR